VKRLSIKAICVFISLLSGFCAVSFGQASPDLENGFKNYGSYDGSNIDTVNAMNGNLMVHIPMPWTYSQRGGAINPRNLLTVSSKTWQVECIPENPNPAICFWTPGFGRSLAVALAGSGLGFDHSMDMSLHRQWQAVVDSQGNVSYSSFDYSLFTSDGGSHPLSVSPGAPLDSNGDPMALDASDTSGFHVDLSSPDSVAGTPTIATVRDRHGNVFLSRRYLGPTCRQVPNGSLPGSGSTQNCSEATGFSSITDVNGNIYTMSTNPVVGPDTMGRPFQSFMGVSTATDTSGCVSNGLTLVSASTSSYAGPNGATNQVKMCYASVNIATAFEIAGVNEGQSAVAVSNGSPSTPTVLATLILPDGSKWSFSYDSYVNLTYIGLPTGGSISYNWTTVAMGTGCSSGGVSRAVLSRVLNDNNGHTFTWNYHWGTPANGALSNTVTDPLLNDTDHNFTSFGGCSFYETNTKYYSGTGSSRAQLKQVDTIYSHPFIASQSSSPGATNAVPTSIQTTLLPSGKFNLVTKSYDSGLGAGFPIFGNVVSEKVYDWAPAGTTNPVLLRETDASYQWQIDARYLTARLLDLPASVIVKDGSGNKMAETDYAYDEPAYIRGYEATVGALPTGTHVAAPNPVRGLQTTVSKWLNPGNTFTAGHANWYDTGELHQLIDPLNHTTTHSYDPVFAGAYSTQTCAPATSGGSITHCIAGSYDFQTGALASLTNENGQISNFTYDAMERLTLSQAPPDPGNGNARAQTSVNYSTPNIFPLNVQRLSSITGAMNDSSTNFMDGLGRRYQNQHITPQGNSTVVSTFDAFDRTTTITNPFFSTTDTTYGTTQTFFDALGRSYQTTKQDGSIVSDDYSAGNCVTSTDEAGHQRKSCSDALGRLIEVDEPNAGASGFASQGSVSIGQLSRTPVIVGAQPPTTASGIISISGIEKSTVVTTQAATSGSANIQIAGLDNSQQSCTDPLPPKQPVCHTVYDGGTITITINVNGTLISQQTTYGNVAPSTLANNLRQAFTTSNSATFTVLYTTGADNFTLVAKAAGAATNYPITYSITSNQGGSGFSFSRAPAFFTGGANAVTATRFDAGSVNFTVNGHLNSASFGQGDNAVTVANRLISAVNGDGTAYASASLAFSAPDQSSASITLTARSAGAGGNYSVSSSYSFDAADFSSSSFTTSAPLSLANGSNSNSGTTFFDSGTVTMSVGGFTATAPYGPSTNNTAIAVAAALAGSGATGLNRPGSPVTASASGAGIILSYLTPGTGGNVAVNVSSAVDPSVAAYFSGSTYNGISSLNGGSNPLPADLTNPYVTLYQYDALGNLLRVDQKGSAPTDSTQWRSRLFTYDSLSRLLIAHNPESGTITYSYDADGNLLQKTSPAPNQTGASTQTITYCYDELHRVTGKAYGVQTCPLTSPVVTYTYDSGANAIGKLTSLTDQAGSASYTFDPLGRMATETRVINGVSKSMSYDYNLDGSIKTIHYPSGAAVTYTPDTAGRMLSAVDAGNNINYITGATYQADGQLTAFVSGNAATFAGITNIFNFNKRLQPINMSASAPSQTVFSIGCDFHVGNGVTGADNGNVWGITNYKDNSRNQSFTYDSLNRLTSAQNGGTNCAATTVNAKAEYWGNSYGYDAWGNLTNKTVTKCGAENLSAPSLVNNQLSGYTYDAAGNMTSDPTDGVSLTFDQENRITGASGYTYTYDADGNRAKKTNGSTGTLYWYMSPGIVAESDLSGALKSEYAFFDGKRVARRDLVAPGGVFYYFSDHLKTASVVTDSLGNIKSESDYYPWGGELQFVANDSNHYKFTGEERDETGLDYFGARYYSNGTGRFITPDPLGGHQEDPQSFNRYSYVRNIPTSLTDPTGLDFALACEGDSLTCQNGVSGQTVSLGNGNWAFKETQVGNDSQGNLVDNTTNTGSYSAQVTGAGVKFSQGNKTWMGSFIDGTSPTNIQGTGDLAGFNFTFSYSNPYGNVNAGGTFTYNGTAQQAEAALEKAGFHHYTADEYDIFHPSDTSQHSVDFRSPGEAGTGAGSGHFTVHEPWLVPWTRVFGAGGPTEGELHLGEHNNNTPGGFIPHTQEVFGTLGAWFASCCSVLP
jgi:RHS repeat-associated protein